MSDRRWPAPWVFSLLILPLGIVVGIKFTPLPYLLASAGVPVDRIASISSIVNLPGVFIFLWAPLVDVKLRRRTWLAIATLATALSVCVYFPVIGAKHLNLMTALILAGGVADSLVAAACGGLLVKLLSEPDQGKGSAWLMAGQLGGGALGGALVLRLAERLPLVFVGLIVAALISLPALLTFALPEPPPSPSPWFQGRLAQIWSEIWAVVRAPDRRWGTLLLLGPGCTGAAQSLLPAVASHYGVGATGVMWTNSLAGGAALAVGASCGALVPGEWDRRLTYAGAGLLNASAAVVLLIANQPFIYQAGTLLYLFTEGLCWARCTALIVDIVGAETHDASTLYSVLTAVATIPLLYMIQLDGLGFSRFGTHGLLWTDAAANVVVFAVVVAVFMARGLPLRHSVGSPVIASGPPSP
jgi:MFS transporter, PAT family, beta-lactamase induction signal transducer AmpG